MEIRPVFEKNCVAVCFTPDEKFMPSTAVAIQSIIENSAEGQNYDICVIHTTVSSHFQKLTRSLCDGRSNISIRFFNISEQIKKTDFYTESVYTGTNYTKEAYYRLLIPTLMPRYEKVIYLDGDLMALSDVSELFQYDLGNNMVAAVRDYGGIGNCYIPHDPRYEYRHVTLGLKNIDDYFISGVLVFNNAEFNKAHSGDELVELCSSREWRQHDQDVLNVICEGKTMFVDPSWDVVSVYGNSINSLPSNLYEEYADSLSHPKIIHFAGPRKPWKYDKAMNSDDFWRCAHHTPFFDRLFFEIGSNNSYKTAILSHLFQSTPNMHYSKNDVYLTIGKYYLGNLSDSYALIELIDISNHLLKIEGFVTVYGLSVKDSIQVYASINGSLYNTVDTGRSVTEYRFDRVYRYGIPFKIIIPINLLKHANHTTVKIVYKINKKHYVINKNLKFGEHTGISVNNVHRYRYSDGYLITPMGDAVCYGFQITKSSIRERFAHELKYIRSIIESKEDNFINNTLIKILFLRIYSQLPRRKKIWLISDRDNIARDNGECLFKYLTENKDKTIRPFFVISSDSADYARLKKMRYVIKAGGFRHKLLFARADKVISSHYDPLCTNLLSRDYYSCCYNFDYVFLQHGVIKDDLSKTYSVYRNNMKMFVTSTKSEYLLIANNPNYGCFESNTFLTGMPRFDNLYNNPSKCIIIMPTWRKYCLKNNGSGKWSLSGDFINSPYYDNYQKLFSSQKLKSVLKKKGYEIYYIPHQLMKCANDDFDFNEIQVIDTKNISYSELFSKGALLITDYSSIAFDFAYLQKPIIYWHFDKELFYSTHTYEPTNYDYQKHGFGDVVESLDDLITKIEEFVETDCVNKKMYIERINDAFVYNDKGNCKRVVDAIKHIGEK